MATLELTDVQGLVFFGYGSMKAARYLHLQVHDAARGRAWLREIVRDTTTAEALPRELRAATNQNLAFTAPGLKALGLDDDALATFSIEFREGMADPYRARILGDRFGSDPEHWEIGQQNNEPHVLLMLFAADVPALDDLVARHRERWERTGGAVTLLYEQPTIGLVEAEHFGFRDGIASTAVKGGPVAIRAGETPVEPGEFLLGYLNEYGKLPFTPTVPSEQDPGGLLPIDQTPGSRRRDLGRNGTYLVYRKLRQDVRGFWEFCDAHTKHPDGTPDPTERTRLASKMVGRWPSGAPLVNCPENDDCDLGADPDRNNAFLYAATDPHGLRCPLGAHIRRSNPRDSLPPSPSESIVMVNRHRLLRRGRLYGPLLLDPLAPSEEPDAGADRGLVFLCINANIARQFEFVQQTWLNDPKFHGLYDNRDPISGDNKDLSVGAPDPDDDGGGIPFRFTIPGEPVRRRIDGMHRFVHVRGGAYFFLPGIRALRFLAGEHEEAL